MTGKLTEAERQAVDHLIEAGIGQCTEKLGQLSATGWNIVSSSVKEISYVNVLAMFADEQAPHLAALLRSRSLLPLEILVLFPDRSIRSVADAVTAANSEQLKDLPDRLRVILAEIANILGQGIIRSMVNALKISVILSVPRLLAGRKAELVAQALAGFDDKTHTLLLSHVNMHSDNLNAECSMILILDTAVLRRMLKTAVLG